MKNPILENGWLIVPYEGVDTSLVEIGVSNLVGSIPSRWQAAYLDYHQGKRVAKIKMYPVKLHSYMVYMRVDGNIKKGGKVVITK